jgi:Tfp pilus assembly protein PilO
VSRTYRILIAAVIAVVAGGGYWKLALAPKRAEADRLAQALAVQEAQLAQTQSLINTYQGSRDAYTKNYAAVVRLGKAVPSDDDTRSLLVQLDTSAKRSGIDFDAVNINGSSTAAGGAADVIPGAINVGAFSALPFTFSFSGQFSTLGGFLARLESFVSVKGDEIAVNGRLLRIENLSLAPGDKGWPSLVARVGASSYIVPQAAPLTADASGATPQTTSTTTAASAGGTGTDIR